MKETLCWSCTKPGTGRCSWDRALKPVKGWSAVPSQTDGFGTYRVLSCPLYEKEPPRRVLDEQSKEPARLGRDSCEED